MPGFERRFTLNLSAPDWEIHWPRYSVLQDGTEVRASCQLTPTEYGNFMRAANCVCRGMRRTTQQRYEIWESPRWPDVRVLLLKPTGQ